ncbi:MAG: ArdC family protein [Psychrobacillus sp.]
MAKKYTNRRTAEEKQEQVEGLLKTLEEGVLNFQYDPEKFKALLKMQSLMYSYSFNNVMLIKQQFPNATYVASFARWKNLNRNVRKGEKAIRVLAPRLKKEIDEITGEEQSKLIGFIATPVFDVSQTEGEPLPIEAFTLELNGESDEAIKIFEWVKLLAEEDDCPVQIGFANGACGYYSPMKHEIMIDESLSINHRAKTAVHELVHSRVHRYSTNTSKEEKESVAEGVAFIICSYFGLDTSDYSFEYVRGWSSDNGESLKKYCQIIQKTAQVLITDFERVSTAIPYKEVAVNESNKKSA